MPNDYKEDNQMKQKSLLMTGLALGAAYMLRNKDSRQKVMDQVQSVTGKMKNKTMPSQHHTM